jgi:hypothetical protein
VRVGCLVVSFTVHRLLAIAALAAVCWLGRRWYMMQAVPLVFIGGLLCFAAVGRARVRLLEQL